MLFLIIKFVAANPVNIADSGIVINPNAAVAGGSLISIPDCFPFCGVEAGVQEIKNVFEPCFPFCDVPIEQPMNVSTVLKVPELPPCFNNNNCGSTAIIPPTVPDAPSLFAPCFPFCGVPLHYYGAVFPSCFPFCGVTPVAG